MPSITLRSPGPLVAGIHMTGATVRDVGLVDLGDGLVQLDLGDADTGVSITVRADILGALLADAETALARLRGRR